MIKRRLFVTTLLAFLLACAAPALAAPTPGNPLSFPQASKAPEEFYVVTEIPAGASVKYETDSDFGFVVVDRFMSMPVGYPANYGSVAQSKGGDGDPIDALVITRFPLVPGSLILVRPIGVLQMVDGGDPDSKIIAVPVSKIDPTYDAVKSVNDLPAMELQRIEAFFRVYKQLPSGKKPIEIKGFDGVDAAKQLVRQALDAYKAGK